MGMVEIARWGEMFLRWKRKREPLLNRLEDRESDESVSEGECRARFWEAARKYSMQACCRRDQNGDSDRRYRRESRRRAFGIVKA